MSIIRFVAKHRGTYLRFTLLGIGLVLPFATTQMSLLEVHLSTRHYIIPAVLGTTIGLLIATLVALRREVMDGQRMFRAVADLAQEFIYVCRSDGHYEYVSPSCEQVTGYLAEDFYAQPNFMDSLVCAEDRPEWDRLMQQITQHGTPQKRVIRIRTRSGELRWIEHLCSAVCDTQGTILGVRSTNLDFTERKQTEDALQEAKEKFQSLVESSSDWIWEVDARGTYTYSSPKIKDLLGYEPHEVIGKTPMDLMPAEEQAHAGRFFEKVVRDKKPFSGFENSNLHKDGHLVILETSGVPVFDGAGTLCGFRGIDRDITERKQQQRQLEASRKHLNDVFDSTNDGMFVLDMQGNFIDVNRTAHERLGYSKEEMLALNLSELDTPEFAAKIPARIEQVTQHGMAVFEAAHYRKDGSVMPVEINARIIELQGEKVFLGVVRDITERKWAEKEIHRLAFYDPLTHLPNRRLLLDRLQQATAASTRSGCYGAVLFLDLDHFKTINDTQGHALGDLLLIEVAHRLQTCVREGDSVARLGGDEFVVVLKELNPKPDAAATQAELVAEKIRSLLDQPYTLKNHVFRTTPSIGICLFLDHLDDVEDLLRQSDIAMYQAKKAGRNTIRFFDPQMQAVLEKRAALESDLRQALARQQFRLYYQVQVDSRGKATGAEALLRWEHPERGTVLPNQFVALAEETGLIVPIGLWVLQTACAQLRAWQRDASTRDLTLAVNVSARQFHQAEFIVQVQQVLQQSGAKPSQLKLELTESTVLENIEDAIARMREIRLFGVNFSMDDFGTGYSSLQYLKRLPLDQIKIDRSFVSDITHDPNDAAIVQAIIAMTGALGLNVIAEGVETEAQRDFLDKHGCHVFQGYLYGKPVPVDEFEASLKQD